MEVKEDGAVVRRRIRISDPEFTPPDGGWGWLIILASGLSNLSIYPVFQQFGLIFRDKFEEAGISNTETTTLINVNSAFTACVGLLNGPLFRCCSYRRVAFVGATLVTLSLFITTFCKSFWTYLIIYSIFYGSGIGITQSANGIALNTYFKKKRRIATGLSWSATAFGAIVLPYIITALMGLYKMEGTLLIFSAFAGNAIVCSLLLQPVHWHTKWITIDQNEESKTSKKESPLFNQEKNIDTTNTNSVTQRLLEVTDDLYSKPILGSNNSLDSSKQNTQLTSGINYKVPLRSSLETDKINKYVESEEKYNKEEILETKIMNEPVQTFLEHKEEAEKNSNIFKTLCIIFDFNLLKDPKYLNIMLGITIANFAELNFAILTPFVLQEFSFEKYQIATFMSLLGATDVIVRLIVPFIAEKIGWDNKIFFLIGVLMMAMGRVVLVHTKKYHISLVVAAIMGFGKGLRTVFMALVIPSYVPLERLPAASGLQMATSGVLFLVLGPVVGWIQDLVKDYVLTLHLLNIMTYITTIAWTIEAFITKSKSSKNN